MGQIAANVVDPADIRALRCVLPDDVRLHSLAPHLAKLMRLPVVGADNAPLRYGLVVRGGTLLDPGATLSELDLPDPLTLRIVPEITAGGDDAELFTQVEPDPDATGREDHLIEIIEETALIHDDDLDLRLDVRIDAAVHRQIARFAGQDRHKECAGLLLGTVDVESDARVVHIRAAAPALEAQGTKATVKITAEAWESMLRVRDLDHPDLRIVGWFHTHAGWGVFMSDLDVFIHRHFFPHPNMIAYVLDPTAGRDGFFYWHEGKISLRPSYGLVGTPREIEDRKGRAKTAHAARPDLRDAIIAVLLVAVLYLGITRPPQAQMAVDHPQPTASSRAPAAPERSAAKHAGAEPAAPAENAAREPAAKPDRNSDRVYVISSGDNPWTVADRFYGDGNLGEALAKYNHLSKTQALQIGQEIKLPPKGVLEELTKQ